jgi:hypothetical protein
MKKPEIIIVTLILTMAVAMAGIGTVSIPLASTEVLPAKADRTWVILQNNSTASIYVKADSSTNTVTAANGLLVPANGGTLTIGEFNARNTITAISASGTNTITYQEGNEK